MSNKKWRQPANQEYTPPVAEPVQAKREEPPATATKPAAAANPGTAAGTVPRPEAAGDSPQQPVPQPFRRYDMMVDDDEAQGFINEMTRFLGGIVRRANIVLGKVGVAGLRSTFAGDLPDPDSPEVIQQTIEAAKKTLPRSHPLLALIRYAMAASRLLNRILLTTKPHLFGRPSNAFKSIMHAASACEKFVKGKAPPEAMRQAVADSPL
jgi:hypothetical protein